MMYDYIHVGEENTNYRLLLGRANGQLIDDMAFSNNSQFATWDRPDYYSCATHQLAGWWYNYCAYALLNGVYHYGGKYTPTGSFYNGIYWKDWHGYDYSLKTVTMSLRNR
ncbi:hypothetical protein LSH36_354g02016 [Paralvinella palmiformis]|uniref:Fibrinogen C-terminal domain-containing protein n=1 Tax=Paralvinella palmiformis TaxID=53620 RepID=A0AAD9JEJ6_9ANNE|nr:hypothetical protein LSH36_354g02016 [Paralvinella palmiformis]